MGRQNQNAKLEHGLFHWIATKCRISIWVLQLHVTKLSTGNGFSK